MTNIFSFSNVQKSKQTIFVFFLVCEYYAHEDCKDFAVNDCRETATYAPSRDNVSCFFSVHEFDYLFIICRCSHRQQWDIIITGVKVTCQRIRNVPFVEKLVGQVNVSLEWDVNGVD